MALFEDGTYTRQLVMPDGGVRLKTRIFVEVKATNLTERCTRDGQTVMGINGAAQIAQFSFEAFRFVQHKNVTISTFYLHCTTRLCERSFCSSLQPDCPENRRRKREVNTAQGTAVSDIATVTSGPIVTQVENGGLTAAATHNGMKDSQEKGPLVGVAVTAGVVCVLFISLMVYVVLRLHSRKK
ncbi:hypothetical protein SKAU_G00083410 [Synaphobranchus kaupii]|uniref:ZP domain-containing protein n=1 Tax=Synaphobranchus kaupii TaxID=118154 RepID=A0A9Q1J5T0_SYNKA|nr:hypothetical protein SKAU_G00083410 [Synaphobranchus kaupii]